LPLDLYRLLLLSVHLLLDLLLLQQLLRMHHHPLLLLLSLLDPHPLQLLLLHDPVLLCSIPSLVFRLSHDDDLITMSDLDVWLCSSLQGQLRPP
jgi:hypothetical protein